MDISKKYQKLSDVQHIFVRPDTYVGSMELTPFKTWTMENNVFVHKEINYIPGMYKLFDEILVNAADHHQKNKTCTKIDVVVSDNQISICNNGPGIDIVKHDEYGVYIPELIFGHLRTGENFDDSKTRTVGGRNGYGAKLVNIFSKEFIVETDDGKKRYIQTWKNNMNVCGTADILSTKGKTYTKISFTLDFKKFKVDGLSDDHINLFRKRTMDIAGVYSGSLSVSFNGEKISLSSFRDYIQLYMPSEKNIVHEIINKRWEIAYIPSTNHSFEQVSFVNGISTTKGGTHVNYIVDILCRHLLEKLKRKNKSGVEMKGMNMKAHMWVFINAKIENPTFDSQTKECLTSKHFGKEKYNPVISTKFLKGVDKSGIIDTILQWAENKSLKTFKSITKKTKLESIPKLNDANKAGKSNKCTLILTEGDSASSLALSGLSVVGRDHYGVFPLKGKLLNVRDAAADTIMKNKEIQHLMKIIGLTVGKKYTSTDSLRYSHVMLLTDQDLDGSHIKGLLINFFHHFWPELLAIKNFLQVFITPIVKATHKKETKSFFSLNDFDDWKKTANNLWKIKYYKGLGTNSAAEAISYFKDLPRHVINMDYEGDIANNFIDMAFSKKRIADRKEWLSKYDPDLRQDFMSKTLNYDDFINKELIQFSMADNVRSIPSVVDGLKPSQRKVLFAAFKRKLTEEIKVAQFAGYTSEHAAYHHGEESLMGTIINMAQNYVGSNNYNLLFPSGAFGTRRMGGKDAASPRYIFTRLNDHTRLIFREEDDVLCTYLNDDGQVIEPIHYVPILPFVLINGSSGIGTGWSTDIPSYNPKDIIEWIDCKMGNRTLPILTPWYKKFKGTIEKVDENKYSIRGQYTLKDHSLHIKELPIGTWTNSYKTFLENSGYTDMEEHHQEDTIHFTISLDDEQYESLQKLTEDEILKKLQLIVPLSTNNMVAFNSKGILKRYASPEEILEEFYVLRLEYYQKRKDYWLVQYENEYKELSERSRFIECVVNRTIIIENSTKDILMEKNRLLGFSDEIIKKCLSLSLLSLTCEHSQKFKEEAHEKKLQLEKLRTSTIEDLWMSDLSIFRSSKKTDRSIDEESCTQNKKQNSHSSE